MAGSTLRQFWSLKRSYLRETKFDYVSFELKKNFDGHTEKRLWRFYHENYRDVPEAFKMSHTVTLKWTLRLEPLALADLGMLSGSLA